MNKKECIYELNNWVRERSKLKNFSVPRRVCFQHSGEWNDVKFYFKNYRCPIVRKKYFTEPYYKLCDWLLEYIEPILLKHNVNEIKIYNLDGSAYNYQYSYTENKFYSLDYE